MSQYTDNDHHMVRFTRQGPRINSEALRVGPDGSNAERADCDECGKYRRVHCRGLCQTCYRRLRDAGTLPPKAGNNGRAPRLAALIEENVELYAARAAAGQCIFSGVNRGSPGG